MQRRKRVGILSGAFDPIHDGHVAFALAAIQSRSLDRVFFLVEPRPRRKQGVRALEHRIAMVRAALASHPKLGILQLDAQHTSIPDIWPTIAARFTDASMSLLLGDDSLWRLAHWPHIDMVARHTQLVIVPRRASEEAVRQYMDELGAALAVDFRYSIVHTARTAHASRGARVAIKQGGKPSYVDAAVISYIYVHKLYGSVPGE